MKKRMDSQVLIHPFLLEGRLAVVEWKKDNMEMGLPAGHRIGFDETVKLITEEGLCRIDEMEFARAFVEYFF